MNSALVVAGLETVHAVLLAHEVDIERLDRVAGEDNTQPQHGRHALVRCASA